MMRHLFDDEGRHEGEVIGRLVHVREGGKTLNPILRWDFQLRDTLQVLIRPPAFFYEDSQ